VCTYWSRQVPMTLAEGSILGHRFTRPSTGRSNWSRTHGPPNAIASLRLLHVSMASWQALLADVHTYVTHPRLTTSARATRTGPDSTPADTGGSWNLGRVDASLCVVRLPSPLELPSPSCCFLSTVTTAARRAA
jgi:hypothetical protein